MSYITIRIDLPDEVDTDHVADALNATWWLWKPLLDDKGVILLDNHTSYEHLTELAQQRWDDAPLWAVVDLT